MNIKQQNQIEEAVALISSGIESLDSCARRYGQDWAKIRGHIQVNLLLQGIASSHKSFVNSSFNQEAVRVRLQSQIQQVNIDKLIEVSALSRPPAADSGTPARAEPKTNFFKTFFGSTSFKYKFATAMMAVVLFLSLTTWAVEASGPGDLLYGPKLNLERTGELFSFSPESKTETRLNYAQNRFDEIQQVVQQGRGGNLDQTVSSYEAALKDAIAGADPQKQELIKEKLQRQLAALENLKKGHPNNRQPQVDNLITRLRYLQNRLSETSGSRLPPVQTAPVRPSPPPSQVKPGNEAGKTAPAHTTNPGGTTSTAKTPPPRQEPGRVPRLDLNPEQNPTVESPRK